MCVHLTLISLRSVTVIITVCCDGGVSSSNSCELQFVIRIAVRAGYRPSPSSQVSLGGQIIRQFKCCDDDLQQTHTLAKQYANIETWTLALQHISTAAYCTLTVTVHWVQYSLVGTGTTSWWINCCWWLNTSTMSPETQSETDHGTPLAFENASLHGKFKMKKRCWAVSMHWQCSVTVN